MSKSNFEIKTELVSLLKMREDTLEFITELSEVGDLLFFGGSIRHVYFEKIEDYPRDFDIAIKFRNKNKFNEVINKYDFKVNRFGGYKFNISNTEFDVWDLNNTWAFKNTYLRACEENLVKSVFLNVDGIVFNFNKSKLYDYGITQTIKTKEIDILLPNNPQVELNLLRALIFKKKYNFELSSRLKKLLNDFNNKGNNEFLEQLHSLQFSHYKTEKISKLEIANEIMYIQ